MAEKECNDFMPEDNCPVCGRYKEGMHKCPHCGYDEDACTHESTYFDKDTEEEYCTNCGKTIWPN